MAFNVVQIAVINIYVKVYLNYDIMQKANIEKESML